MRTHVPQGQGSEADSADGAEGASTIGRCDTRKTHESPTVAHQQLQVAHQQLQVAHQQLQVAHQQLQVAHQQLQAPRRGVGHRVHAPGSGSEEGTLTSQQGWPQGQRVKYEVRGANPPRVWAAAGRLQARRRSPACQPLSLGKKVANASLPLLDERARARASVSELVERVPLQQRAPARPPRREPRAL